MNGEFLHKWPPSAYCLIDEPPNKTSLAESVGILMKDSMAERAIIRFFPA